METGSGVLTPGALKWVSARSCSKHMCEGFWHPHYDRHLAGLPGRHIEPLPTEVFCPSILKYGHHFLKVFDKEQLCWSLLQPKKIFSDSEGIFANPTQQRQKKQQQRRENKFWGDREQMKRSLMSRTCAEAHYLLLQDFQKAGDLELGPPEGSWGNSWGQENWGSKKQPSFPWPTDSWPPS